MKTGFQAALAMMLNETMQKYGAAERIDVPEGLPDGAVLDRILDRIEASDLSDEEKEGIVDWLAHLVVMFPPTDIAAGQA